MANAPACDVGIVGAGIIGLTTALTLVEAGYRVGVITRDLPGDMSTQWSSPWAGAAVLPSLSDDPRDVRMQRTSLRRYRALAAEGPETGVQTVKVSEYWDDKDNRESPWYSELPDFRALSVWELPSGAVGGNTYTSTSINPDYLLPWLQKRLEEKHGVLFVRDTVPSLDYAKRRLNCQAVVNASGLGARHLAGDNDVVGIRGQTVLVKNTAFRTGMEREVHMRRGREYTYAIPRLSSGGIIIGGIEDEKRTTSEVDADVRQDIIRRVNAMLEGQLKGLDVKRDVITDVVGFRPARRGGYRVEREGNVVHAYGFAGAGYRYSWGAASEAARLMDELGLGMRLKL